MDKDSANIWLVIVSITAIIFGFGWYNATNASDTSSSNSNYANEASDSDGNTLDRYQGRIDEYDTALNDANEKISRQNSCSDDVYSALDDGDFDSAYEYVQDCQENEVSSPGTSL